MCTLPKTDLTENHTVESIQHKHMHYISISARTLLLHPLTSFGLDFGTSQRIISITSMCEGTDKHPQK